MSAKDAYIQSVSLKDDWQSWYYEWRALQDGATVCGLQSSNETSCPRPKGHTGEHTLRFPHPEWDIVNAAIEREAS